MGVGAVQHPVRRGQVHRRTLCGGEHAEALDAAARRRIVAVIGEVRRLGLRLGRSLHRHQLLGVAQGGRQRRRRNDGQKEALGRRRFRSANRGGAHQNLRT